MADPVVTNMMTDILTNAKNVTFCLKKHLILRNTLHQFMKERRIINVMIRYQKFMNVRSVTMLQLLLKTLKNISKPIMKRLKDCLIIFNVKYVTKFSIMDVSFRDTLILFMKEWKNINVTIVMKHLVIHVTWKNTYLDFMKALIINVLGVM